MAALTLRNIPDDLYQDLKRQAVDHHRSLNKEAVYLLIPGTKTAWAERVYARDADWHAPQLWRSELRNVYP